MGKWIGRSFRSELDLRCHLDAVFTLLEFALPDKIQPWVSKWPVDFLLCRCIWHFCVWHFSDYAPSSGSMIMTRLRFGFRPNMASEQAKRRAAPTLCSISLYLSDCAAETPVEVGLYAGETLHGEWTVRVEGAFDRRLHARPSCFVRLPDRSYDNVVSVRLARALVIAYTRDTLHPHRERGWLAHHVQNDLFVGFAHPTVSAIRPAAPQRSTQDGRLVLTNGATALPFEGHGL